MPNHQLAVPVWMKRNLTLGWPSAPARRRTSTRMDSRLSSFTRGLIKGANACVMGAPSRPAIHEGLQRGDGIDRSIWEPVNVSDRILSVDAALEHVKGGLPGCSLVRGVFQ